MNREYLNTVRFQHDPIVLRKPKKEKLQGEPRPAGSKRTAKVLFTLLLIALSLIVFNEVTVGLINRCKDSEFVTVFDAFADFQKYVEENQ